MSASPATQPNHPGPAGRPAEQAIARFLVGMAGLGIRLVELAQQRLEEVGQEQARTAAPAVAETNQAVPQVEADAPALPDQPLVDQPISTEQSGPPRDMLGLALEIERLYQDGRPIKIVKVGEMSFVLLLAGVALGQGGNNWGSAIQSWLRLSSAYERQAHGLLMAHLPAGARLHLVGHSLGGIVVNNLADDPELGRRFSIRSVVTLGAPRGPHEQSGVLYRCYAVKGDVVPMFSLTRLPVILAHPLGGTRLAAAQIPIAGVPGVAPHRAYACSPDLAGVELPFQPEMTGWETCWDPADPTREFCFHADYKDGLSLVCSWGEDAVQRLLVGKG